MKGRGLVAVVVVSALVVLLPTAFASPVDQTWIPGLYDDADFDDVVLLLTGSVASVASCVVYNLTPILAVVSVLAFEARPAAAPREATHDPRGPPPA